MERSRTNSPVICHFSLSRSNIRRTRTRTILTDPSTPTQRDIYQNALWKLSTRWPECATRIHGFQMCSPIARTYHYHFIIKYDDCFGAGGWFTRLVRASHTQLWEAQFNWTRRSCVSFLRWDTIVPGRWWMFYVSGWCRSGLRARQYAMNRGRRITARSSQTDAHCCAWQSFDW